MGGQSSRPQPLLLAAPAHLRDDSYSWLPPNVKSPYALGGVDLMAGDGEQINIHFVDVNGHLAERLRGIGVEQGFILPANLSNLF